MLPQLAIELGKQMYERGVPVSIVGSVATFLIDPTTRPPNDIDFLIEGYGLEPIEGCEWVQIVSQVFQEAGFIEPEQWKYLLSTERRQYFAKLINGRWVQVDVGYGKTWGPHPVIPLKVILQNIGNGVGI